MLDELSAKVVAADKDGNPMHRFDRRGVELLRRFRPHRHKQATRRRTGVGDITITTVRT